MSRYKFLIVGRRFLLCAIVLVVQTFALAQMDTATLVGQVSDPSDSAIGAARVELVDLDRNTKQHAQTNPSGVYAFSNIKPGHYRVVVSAPGYKTAILPRVSIYVQENIQQDFRMAAGPSPETVIMRANGTPVEITGAEATVVDQTLVRDLPLNGRSFQTLFQLTPGVVIAATNFASQGQFSVNGQRTDTNYFIVDGVSANFGIAAGISPGQTAGGSLPAVTTFGGTNSLVSTDDVQEFAVLTSSYSAQFGRVPGAQISVVTRSGNNTFHGSVFEYLRNDVFDANDWFANRDNLKRPALRQNDYGGVIGGPLRRESSFFFLSYEGLRLRQPSSEETDVPSLSVRKSAPTFLQPFVNAYSLPNGAEEGNGLARATYSFSNPSSLDTGSIRIDHRIREVVSIFGRYDQAVSEHQERGAALDSLSTVTQSRFGLRTLTAAITYRVSAKWMNDLRLNWSQSFAASNDHLDNLGGAVPFLPASAFSSSALPQQGLFQFIGAINAQHSELSSGANAVNTQSQFNLLDSSSFQTGSHLLQFGIDLRKLRLQIKPANYQQQDAFDNLTSAIDGKVSFALIGSFAEVRSTFSNYSAFAQDTWRPSGRLSITPGLRWDYNPAPYARGGNGLQSVAVQDTANLPSFTIAPQGTPLYHAPLNNFAPRFGVAYEIRNSPGTETIIRAGGGAFYDLANVAAGDAVGADFFPFSAKTALLNVSFPLSQLNAQPPAFGFNPDPFSTIVVFPRVLKLPDTWEWNVSVQQSLNEQSLTLSYVGALGLRLLRTEEYVSGSSNFGNLRLTTNGAYSHYESFQVRFQRRSTRGPRLLALYDLSHSLDNSSTESVFDVFNGIPSRFLNPHNDYGPSDFDIRHTATIGLDYELPAAKIPSRLRQILADWAVDSIAMFRSAPPVDVTVSRDIGFGTYDFRPDLVTGLPVYLRDPALAGGRAINPAAVSIPTAQRQGTLARNFFRSFSFSQLDLSLRRQFRIREGLHLQARIEGFNLSNRPNFGLVDGKLGALTNSGTFFPNRGFGFAQATLSRGLQAGTSATFGSGFSPLYQIGGARSLQLAVNAEF